MGDPNVKIGWWPGPVWRFASGRRMTQRYGTGTGVTGLDCYQLCGRHNEHQSVVPDDIVYIGSDGWVGDVDLFQSTSSGGVRASKSLDFKKCPKIPPRLPQISRAKFGEPCPYS